MFTLIKNARTYVPEFLGEKSVLICNETIVWIGDNFPAERTLPGLKIIDAAGMYLIPGFVDGHVHNRVGGCPLFEQPSSHTTVRTVRYTAVR